QALLNFQQSCRSEYQPLNKYLPVIPTTIEPPVHYHVVRTARKHIDAVAPPRNRGGAGNERSSQRLPIIPGTTIKPFVLQSAITSNYKHIKSSRTPGRDRRIRHKATAQWCPISPLTSEPPVPQSVVTPTHK